MDQPLVSIVIPCYNYAHYLPEAIESGLQQTYPSIELIVVDDGSTDDTRELCKRYAPSITYLYKSNGGLSQTRNVGARICHGEYIVFLDADDVLADTYVQECLEVLWANPTAAYVYTQLRFFDGLDGITSHPPFDRELLKRGNYIDACTLQRTAVVRAFPYDEKNRTSWEDWDYYVALAAHGHHGVLLDKPLVWYRRHGKNMTHSLNPISKQRLRVYIMRRHLRFFGMRMYMSHVWRLNRMRAATLYRRLRVQIAQP